MNMTGLKNFNAIENYRKDLERRFQQKVDHVRIYNTFFSRKQKKNIDLACLYDYSKKTISFFM